MSSDRLFDDVFLSEIYDAWHPRGVRDDFDFYMPLIMRARSVLDIGCGTGTLLDEARRSGHQGLLCGIDPGTGVLSRARAFPDVTWVQGTLPRPDWTARFDLAVMTGHAFQAILTDADVDAFLCDVRECLEPAGSLPSRPAIRSSARGSAGRRIGQRWCASRTAPRSRS